MSATRRRIAALADQAAFLRPWLGPFDEGTLTEWLRLEFGDLAALDGWVEQGAIRARATPLSPLLHVVSGNTPHAAFQSLLRGLLVGARNRVKLPSAGLPEVEAWLGQLPESLAPLVEARRDLPGDWLHPAAAVIFGGQATIETFRRLLPPEVPRIEHGPKWSIAVVLEPTAEAARRVAEDVLRFEQRGCQSVQAVFVDAPLAEIHGFGDDLAAALARWREANPRPRPTLSDSGGVANAREIARFRAANGEPLRLWESAGSTAWTIICDPATRLAPGPLNGFVTLHPMPQTFDRATLGPEAEFVSTVALHPFTIENAARLDPLAPPRICAAGMAQEPTIFWHHDGLPSLGSLVRWRDFG